MQRLLRETPATLAEFRAWVRRAAEHIEPKIDRDTLGEFDQELHELVARIVRRAKAHAWRLRLYALAERLPERQGKTCLDGLLRLRECAQWREAIPADDGRAFTVAQAAEYLGISERLARDLIASGELGHHRVGNGRGRIRIRPRDLEDYQSRADRPAFRHLGRLPESAPRARNRR